LAGRKTAVVTGAAGGIGKHIALGLAAAGYLVLMVGRDERRGAAAKAWIAERIGDAAPVFLQADLSSLAGTKALAREIGRFCEELEILVLNAGVFRGKREVTPEGHEMVLAVNCLSPFLLIRELEGKLRAAKGRVVTVGSSTSDHAKIDPGNLELVRHWGMSRSYAQSKLAVMMTSFAWAERLAPDVTVNVVHPGLVATGLVRTPGVVGLAWRLLAPFSHTEAQGAETPLYAALAPAVAGVTGKYLKDKTIVPPNRLALDAALRARVWRAVETLIESSSPAPEPKSPPPAAEPGAVPASR
jgi:NAD(P)-dependent dehydrogenase (short-subunit alcohol dehydrogenase family)